jgi:hypothetical protein
VRTPINDALERLHDRVFGKIEERSVLSIRDTPDASRCQNRIKYIKKPVTVRPKEVGSALDNSAV